MGVKGEFMYFVTVFRYLSCLLVFALYRSSQVQRVRVVQWLCLLSLLVLAELDIANHE